MLKVVQAWCHNKIVFLFKLEYPRYIIPGTYSYVATRTLLGLQLNGSLFIVSYFVNNLRVRTSK